jgi:xylulokinase
VASDLRVREGAPVVCGVPDFFAAYLGSGAVGEYEAHVAVSTTSWLTCRVPGKKVDPIRMMASVPGVAPGSYLIINDQAAAGYCLRWWMDRLAEVTTSVDAVAPGYSTVLADAARVPRGSDGVIFLPWLRGEHTPVDDRSARGGFVNVSARNGLPQMTRAVLEGVALNGRWLLTAVEGFAKKPFPSIRILGGGAQSDLWCQIYADVLGIPVERVADPMFAQLRGAAMLAMIGMGETTLDEAAALVPVSDRFIPEPGSGDVYDPLFAQFTGIFKSLRKHHQSLNG